MTATVDGLEFYNGKKTKGVRITLPGRAVSETMEYDDIVIAMGPWSGLTSNWLPHVRVTCA